MTTNSVIKSPRQTADREPGPNLPTAFDGYEIHGVREFEEAGSKWCEQVPDDEAAFWSHYGHIPNEGLECIGDFDSRQFAEQVYARITGRQYRNGGRT